MLVCLPTKGSAGLKDEVFEHFGSAPYFTLYDTETNEISVLKNRNEHHSHGTCHPMNQLGHYRVDCIICGGMGRRAIEALSAEGIKVYQSDSASVEDSISRVKSSSLAPIDPLKACRGHGQHHGLLSADNTHECQSGRGAGFGRGLGQGRSRKSGRGGNQIE